MLKRPLPRSLSTNKQEELQSMRRGRKGQTCGKGLFLKAVINGIVKQELWIGDRQEGVCQSNRGQDKDTKRARVRGNRTHLHTHVSLRVRSELV